MSADTVGLFIDTTSENAQDVLAEVMRCFKNADFQDAMTVAQEVKARFIIAAGRLNLLSDGVFVVLAHEELEALRATTVANRRLAEAGSTATRWLVAAGPDVKRKALKVLEVAS
jgi:hypothetical protein